MTETDQLLKVDVAGWVWTPRARREGKRPREFLLTRCRAGSDQGA